MTDALGFSFGYPVSNSESKYGPLIKLTLLILASVFVVPAFTVLGYTLRVREAALRGDEEIPNLTEYLELTKEGVFATTAFLPYAVLLISVIYLIPAVMFFGMSSVGAESLGAVYMFGVLVAMVFYLLGLYAAPAMLSVYAAERNWRSMYSSQILEFMKSKHYFVASLLYIALLVGLYIIGLIAAITIIGVLLVAPYASMVRNAYWGAKFREMSNGPHEGLKFSREKF